MTVRFNVVNTGLMFTGQERLDHLFGTVEMFSSVVKKM